MISTCWQRKILTVIPGNVTHLRIAMLQVLCSSSTTNLCTHLLGTRVATQGKIGNHLLVGKLIPLCTLDHSIQHQDVPIGFTEERWEAHMRTWTAKHVYTFAAILEMIQQPKKDCCRIWYCYLARLLVSSNSRKCWKETEWTLNARETSQALKLLIHC